MNNQVKLMQSRNQNDLECAINNLDPKDWVMVGRVSAVVIDYNTKYLVTMVRPEGYISEEDREHKAEQRAELVKLRSRMQLASAKVTVAIDELPDSSIKSDGICTNSAYKIALKEFHDAHAAVAYFRSEVREQEK
jgi:hypothetical protein